MLCVQYTEMREKVEAAVSFQKICKAMLKDARIIN